ncbi:MAG: hypothetical protein MI922_26990, partial [Bacteroidales bacterium]|nr:hypothetical protein [Bacteroidales bacterium]
MSKSSICILLFILVKVQISFGQKNYTPEQSDPLMESWRWRHFPEITKYGVQILAEDEKGTIWFATGQGLVSYDGYKWLEHPKPEGVDWGQLFDMAVYKNRIYISRKKGLIYFDGQSNTWTELIDIAVPTKVYRFVNQSLEVHSSTGDVYLSSTQGLIYYNGQQVYLYTSKKGKLGADTLFPGIRSVVFPEEMRQGREFSTRYCTESPKGEIYIVNTTLITGGGILKVTTTGNSDDPLHFSANKEITGSPNPGYKTDGTYINENELWFGSRLTNKKISILKDNHWSSLSVCELFGDRDIYSGIVQMNDGSILVASEGQMYASRNNEWKRYQFPDIPVTSTGYILI